MKPTALLFALLLSLSCASSSSVIDERTIQCAPGQPIEIVVAFEDGRKPENVGQSSVLVIVANNSSTDLTVTWVRVVPSQRNRIRYEAAVDSEDVTLAPGEEHEFRTLLREPLVADPEISNAPTQRLADSLEVLVKVHLSNGDQYYCEFVVPMES